MLFFEENNIELFLLDITMKEIARNLAKKCLAYNCECCQFITDNKTNFNKHMMTAKHKNLQILQENARNLAKSCLAYTCDGCQFITDNKTNFNKHMMTAKHKNLQILQEKSNNFGYACECCDFITDNKTKFNKHMLNSKHKNVVDDDKNQKLYDIIKEMSRKVANTNESLEEITKQNKVMAIKIANTNDKIHEITEIQDKLLESNKLGGYKTVVNNNNISFNLNIFLNETCKYAYSISEFMDTLQMSIDDFHKWGQFGFRKAVSDFLTANLNMLSHTKRPIHCTDSKRKIYYLKLDNGEWTNDKTEYMESVIKAFNEFQKRHFKFVRENKPDEKERESVRDKYDACLCQFYGIDNRFKTFDEQVFTTFEDSANEMVIPK